MPPGRHNPLLPQTRRRRRPHEVRGILTTRAPRTGRGVESPTVSDGRRSGLRRLSLLCSRKPETEAGGPCRHPVRFAGSSPALRAVTRRWRPGPGHSRPKAPVGPHGGRSLPDRAGMGAHLAPEMAARRRHLGVDFASKITPTRAPDCRVAYWKAMLVTFTSTFFVQSDGASSNFTPNFWE